MSRKNNLQKATEEWKQLERKTEEQRKEAENYYASNLMGLIEEAFIKNNRDKVYENVEYLIMSVGTSYEPLVLNIQLLKPEKILFLYTDKTKTTLNRIVEYCKLDISAIEMEKVSETDPVCIYQEIKRAYLEWDKPNKLYIDFTGGTKAMSAAAAMAGSLISVQLVYVGTNDYLVDFRKPEPGSETLYYISNPIEIFGDLEIEKAVALFGQYNYSGAAEKLNVLKEQVPDPELRQQLNFVFLLAKTYEAWDALEFQDAYDMIQVLNRQLNRDKSLHSTFWLMDMAGVLQKQQGILEKLLVIPELAKKKDQMGIFENRECMISLMFTLYQNAMVRQKQEKYDMATLLMYRLLEMVEQKRLANYGLNVSRMEYGKIPYGKCGFSEVAQLSEEEQRNWLRNEILDVKKQMFKNANRYHLPEQISLLDGFTLLHVLGDAICESGKITGVNKLKMIRSMVFLRNNSIFAHGLGPVSREEYSKFRGFVETIFHEFCQIEGIPFEEYKSWIAWVNPIQSRNYSGMEV